MYNSTEKFKEDLLNEVIRVIDTYFGGSSEVAEAWQILATKLADETKRFLLNKNPVDNHIAQVRVIALTIITDLYNAANQDLTNKLFYLPSLVDEVASLYKNQPLIKSNLSEFEHNEEIVMYTKSEIRGDKAKFNVALGVDDIPSHKGRQYEYLLSVIVPDNGTPYIDLKSVKETPPKETPVTFERNVSAEMEEPCDIEEDNSVSIDEIVETITEKASNATLNRINTSHMNGTYSDRYLVLFYACTGGEDNYDDMISISIGIDFIQGPKLYYFENGKVKQTMDLSFGGDNDVCANIEYLLVKLRCFISGAIINSITVSGSKVPEMIYNEYKKESGSK